MQDAPWYQPRRKPELLEVPELVELLAVPVLAVPVLALAPPPLDDPLVVEDPPVDAPELVAALAPATPLEEAEELDVACPPAPEDVPASLAE